MTYRELEFVAEALEADREIEQGGEVSSAADVHGWLARLAGGEKTTRPDPRRG